VENERYIYGVGLVVVKGALVEHLLRQLVPVVMAGGTEAEITKALKGNFEPVAEKLKAVAPTYLAGEQDLIDRLNDVLADGIRYMRQRGELAHSTWILDTDPVKPPGFDTRLHIKSESVWYVGGKAFDSIAHKLGLISVKLMELTSDILERRGEDSQPPPPE
jgi:hypothetical protein